MELSDDRGWAGGWASGWEAEVLLGAALVAWIAYELYGREALAFLTAWASYIRMAGGALVVLYLYWQLRNQPEHFRDTLDLAQQLLTQRSGSPAATGTREKRNVSGLMKKKIAAAQQWRCGDCGSLLDETYEVDHRLALFQGGSNDESNLVALCPHCHRKKTVAERLR